MNILSLWGRDFVSVVHIRESLFYRGFFLQKILNENFFGTLETVRNAEVSVRRGSTLSSKIHTCFQAWLIWLVMDSKLFSVSWTHYFWPREVNIFLKRFIFLYFLVVFDNKHCLRYKILHLNKSYMSLLRHYKYTETKRPLKWPYILHKEFCLCCFLTVRPM